MTDPIGSVGQLNSHMTGRLRLIVRLLDIYAEDLSTGTPLERAVGVLLGHVATVIVNDQVAETLIDIEPIAARGPRRDRVKLARDAEIVAMDKLELPDSYTGIGGQG